MTSITRTLTLLLCICLLASACAETVVLLPNQEGQTGAVVITPHDGSPALLDQPYAKVSVSESSVGEPAPIGKDAVERQYGEIFRAEPPAPLKFILYFFNDETRLKPDSKALLDQIAAAYQERQSTDVSVVGHTDRAGDPGYNMQLSKLRADAVARLLIKKGLDAEIMEITSHGENNPYKPTADGVHEPLNRRVEVTIR